MRHIEGQGQQADGDEDNRYASRIGKSRRMLHLCLPCYYLLVRSYYNLSCSGIPGKNNTQFSVRRTIDSSQVLAGACIRLNDRSAQNKA